MNNHRELIAELRDRREALRKIRDRVALAMSKVETDPAEHFALGALALEVHYFYCCVEDAAYHVGMDLNGEVPPYGAHSHEDLLKQMYREVPGRRTALFRRTLLADLDELRRFRHFLRHNYAAEIDRERMLDNARRALRIHPDIEADLAALEAHLQPPP